MPTLDLKQLKNVDELLMPKIFWQQARALTGANLKSRYRKTVAGFLWVVLNPLILYGTQAFVFHTILKIQVNKYHLFLVSGLLPWIFITQSIEMCTSILTNSARLLKSFPVHPLVYLGAQLLDNLINFLATFFLILIPTLVFDPGHAMGLLLLPLPMLILFTGVLGICWLLAVTQVFFRDTRFIISFVLNILFFLTPIFYPLEFVPESYRWMVAFNPANYLIQPFRAAIYDFDPARFIQTTAQAAAVSLAILGLAIFVWMRKRNDVYHNL